MAQNYQVNYKISVDTSQATKNLGKFTVAVNELETVNKRLEEVRLKLIELNTTFNNMSTKPIELKIKTQSAKTQLDDVIAKLNTIQSLSKNAGVITTRNITTHTDSKVVGGSTSDKKGKKNKKGKSTKGQKTKVSHSVTQTHETTQLASLTALQKENERLQKTIQDSKDRASAAKNVDKKTRLQQRKIEQQRSARSKASYRALGPSMLDTGGIGILSMAKGMGIAYGITGLTALMGQAMKDASTYDNIIQSTKNILQTHDAGENFESRFAAMERVIRAVGVATKFSAPEVADASKFLAMAGFNLSDINKSIRPIADIALVGDSDLGATADVVTNIMTGYGIDAGRVRNAADVMTQTFTMTNTTLLELADAYKYAASLLSAGGVSFEEATAGLGVLGDAGIKGSQAGTTMRTILSNIARPTKNQAAVWDKMGIKRLDKNGNIRDLVDIFTDLSQAGMNVADFYRMFHRTAAAGAVALTKNVDKWHKVLEQNFLSEGLSKKLAEKKKNTIEGLWKQITSTFTEQGMRAFEALNSPIRKFLNKTLDWLRSDSAAHVLQTISNLLLNITQTLVHFTGVLMKLYDKFAPFVNLWLKLQLYLTTVLMPLRVFKGLMNFGTLFITGAQQIAGFSTQLSQMGTRFSVVTGKMEQFRVSARRLGAHVLPGIVLPHKGASSEAIGRYQRMYGDRLPNTLKGMGGGFGAIAGSMAGAYYGSNYGMAGTLLGSVLGGAGGQALGILGGKALHWGMATATPWLFTNPLGWAALVTGAIAGVIISFYKSLRAAAKATDALVKYAETTQTLNGISLSEHATMTDKYLSIVHDKQKTANEAVAEHIKLRQEELGLLTQLSQMNGKTFKDQYKDMWDALKGVTDPGWLVPANFTTASAVEAMGVGNHKLTPVLTERISDPLGAISRYNFAGQDYELNANPLSSAAEAKRLLLAQNLASLGYDTSKNSPIYSTLQKFDKLMLLSKNTEDALAVKGQIQTYIAELQKSMDPKSRNWMPEDIENMQESEWKKHFAYITAVTETLTERYLSDSETGSNAHLERFKALFDVLKVMDEGGTPKQAQLLKFLELSGAFVANEEKFGKFGGLDFLTKLGWDNEKKEFVATAYKDENGIEHQLTSDQAQAHFGLIHDQITQTIGQLNTPVRKLFEGLLLNPMWRFGGGNKNGDNGKATLDGNSWIWDPDKQMWFTKAPIKNNSMTNPEMLKRLQATVGFNRSNVVPTVTEDKIPKTDPEQYKSHYHRGTATPKQVIVKIENLMNVEAIDMTNPDNEQVINSFKGQLTDALVGVVRDFDETYHG